MFTLPAATALGLPGAAVTIGAYLALQPGFLRGQGYRYMGLNALLRKDGEVWRYPKAALSGHPVDKLVRGNLGMARSRQAWRRFPEYAQGQRISQYIVAPRLAGIYILWARLLTRDPHPV